MVAFGGIGTVSAGAGADTPSQGKNPRGESIADRARLIGTWSAELPDRGRFSVSPEFCRIFGVDPERWDGSADIFFGRIHPDDRNAVAELHVRCIALGVPYSTVYRVVAPGQVDRWVYADARVLRDADGRLRAACGTVAELLEDKAEDFATSRQEGAALLEPHLGREHLAIVQHITESGSAEIDLITHAAVWTEQLYRVTGWDPDAASPTFEEFLRHVHADDRERVRRLILLSARGERIEPFEFRFTRPDGVQIWLRRHSEFHADAAGRPHRLVEVYQEISERKLLEARLAERDEALRSGKAHLDVAQRIARVGSVDRDLVTRRVSWSDETYRLIGYRPGEVEPTRETFFERVHPDDRALVERVMNSAWAGEALDPVEYRLLLPEGTVRWVLRETAVILDAAGKPAHSVSTLMDITERKRLELELRRREDHLNLAQRIARVGSIERDLRTGTVIVSEEVYRLLGLEPGSVEATVENMAARTHPDDVPLIRALHEAAWSGKPTPPIEYRVIRADGVVVWVHREAVITHDDSGKPIQSVSTLIDITERKRMEAELVAGAERLQRSEEHLNRAQRVAHVGSVEVDLRTGEAYWSDEFYRLLGYEPRSVPPTVENRMARVHPDDMAMVAGSVSAVNAGEEVPPLEYRVRWPDGSVHWIYREVAYNRDDGGKPVLATMTYIDVTERKKLELEAIENAERLRRSEAHLKRAQSVAHVGSIEVDLRTERVFWSDEQFRLFGFEPGEIEPSVAAGYTRVHPDDHAKVNESVALIRAGVEPPPLEYRLLWPDGTVRWITREVAFTRDANGQPIAVTITLVDITERKKLESAAVASARQLRRSQEHLERAQRVGLIGSAQIDVKTGEGVWTDQYYRLLGLDPASSRVGQASFRGAIHPEDLSKLQTYEELLAYGGPIPPVELRIPLPGGEVRWLQRQVEVICDAEGQPTYLVFTLQDITERKHLEAALVAYADELRSSREHLARAQQAGQVGSLEYNVQTGAMYWSDETFRLLGVDRGEAPTRDRFIAAVHPDDRHLFDLAVEQARAGLPIEPVTFRVVRPDGEIRWIYRVAELTRDNLGTATIVIATLTDVTELRHAQREQARLQEHLAHAQRLESLGALSGGIAHDFNNLLTTILGNAALLRDDESLSPDANHLAQAVLRAGQQGAELTRRLLSFGRRQILNPVVVDLIVVARDLDTLLRRTIGEQLELDIKFKPGLWRVRADKSQLEAAIVNLAVNARDAMPEGGNLTIEMENRVFDEAYVADHAGAVSGEYVAISVSDTGTGMTPDILERAFEPFFTTKQEGRGTGLGLSMVYGFAKQSGGYTSIYSELGAGTSVTIFLPRGAQEEAAAEATVERRAKARGGTEHILLVEDDTMVREFLVTALERLGYRVTAMPDAHAALAYLQDETAKIDLLLTDLMLPGGMNGNHLAAAAAEKRPGLRVLFASGYTQDALIRQGRLEPGQRLIAKPFASGELAAKVREVLDS